MMSDEWRALGRLATRAVVQTVDRVHEVQRAVADRSFRSVGPLAPVRHMHDGISTVAYGSTRGIAATVGCATSEALGAVAPYDRGGTPETVALGVINGAVGDRLDLERDPLAFLSAVRASGGDVEPTAAATAAAFPRATGRIAVFVHGLGETEDAWRLDSRRHYGDTVTTHGSQLARDLDFTPVYVRYNTGRRLDDSAADLDDLLERLVLPWPVAVDELALIGHSMGALVARAAHLRATERGATWPAHCGHLVFLGAPHLGAPLERGAALLGRALDALPETRPFATILDVRSAGIRDLGRGHQARGCWVRDDAVRPIAEHFIVATLARNPRGRAGAVIGDLLVTPRSAAGSHCAQCEVRLVDSVTTIGGLSHMDLLNHPAVYAELRDSLTCTTTPRARTR